MKDDDQIYCDISGYAGDIARYAGGLWLMGEDRRRAHRHIHDWMMRKVQQMCADLGGRFVPNDEVEP